MNIIFAGPSLYHAEYDDTDIEVRPPASQGDITRAVLSGATLIGLIDGRFGSIAAVWHKEILFALSSDVRVLGSSSMGALRAAECAAYGMEPIGSIAHRFLSGEVNDDAAVAMQFGPAEMGYAPLTEPLVDVDEKISSLLTSEAISHAEADALAVAARALFYADRTAEAMVAHAFQSQERSRSVLRSYQAIVGCAKQNDALELIAHIRAPIHQCKPRDWQLSEPTFWRQVLSREKLAASLRHV